MLKRYTGLLTAALVMLWASSAEAQTVRKVCASGTSGAGDDTYSLTQLQNAINDSVGSDFVLLQRGYEFVGSYLLPRHSGSTYVTVRTGVESNCAVTSTSVFPAANIRMTSTLATAANLATVRSNADNGYAFRTSDPSGGLAPEYWRLEWLRLASNTSTTLVGGGSILACGSDSNSVVTAYTEIASNFVFSQLYITGDPVSGQFRGISLHCNNTTIQDSTVEHIKSKTEGQALWMNSFESGVVVTNNTFSGGTEVVMSGGGSGAARPAITVLASPAPTTTSATLSGRSGLRVGKSVTFEVAGVEQQTEIVSCGTSTPGVLCTSDAVTFTALTAAPDSPGDVDWGLNPGGVTFTKNYVTRPLSLRDPILGAPQSMVASASASGGTLAAGTYSYRVVARRKIASSSTSDNTAQSAASVEVSATTTGSTGSVQVCWAAVTNATEYRVYGRQSGAQNTYWTVTAPTVCYTDTNASGTTGSVPTSAGTAFYVKNLFELKNMDGMTIEGNVFENSWFMSGGQLYAITLTPSNTGATNDSTIVKNITFRYNIVRNAPGGVSICGRDCSTTSGNGEATGRTSGLTISHNVFHDINSSWGGTANWMLLTTKYDPVYVAGQALGPKDLVLEHNTIDNATSALVYFDLYKTSAARPVENFTFRNNLTKKAGYGFFGGNSCAQGSGCLTMFTSGTTTYGQSVIAGASCSSYPVGTLCPSTTTLENDYTNYAAKNFLLKATSAYHNTATDGTDIGADIAEVNTRTAVAISGDNTGGAPVVPPSVTTSTLPNGQRESLYGGGTGVSVVGVCPAPPCTWSATGLPTGTTIATVSSTEGRISGTLSAPGLFTPTVTITDTGSRTGSQSYSISVAEVIIAPTRPDRWNLDERVLFGRATDPASDGEPVRTGDLLAAVECSTPQLRQLKTTSPTPVWQTFAIKPTLTVTTLTTAGVVTYAASELVGGLILRDPNGGNRSDVTPTAALIVAAIPCAAVGDTFNFDIRNTADAAETITVTAGAGVTLSGTMTIAQNNTRRFRAVVTNVETPAVTIYSMGTVVH